MELNQTYFLLLSAPYFIPFLHSYHQLLVSPLAQPRFLFSRSSVEPELAVWFQDHLN